MFQTTSLIPGLHVVAVQVCLNFSVRRATDSAELRAAADLRAGTFYEYPVDRSVLSTRVRASHGRSAHPHGAS